MRRAWAALVGLLGEREPGRGIALFRVAVALVVLGAILSMALSGVDRVLWVDARAGGMLTLPGGDWLLAALGGPTPGAVRALEALGIALAAAVALGAGGRLPILALGQVYLALISADPHVQGGYDSMIVNALWLLFLADATATGSVDARLRCGAWWPEVLVPAWPRYLVVFQLVVVYTATGLQKLGFPWTPAGGFSALYWVFQEPTWRRFDMSWSAWVYPLTQVATAITWLWEIGAPIVLVAAYVRRTRGRPGRLRALLGRWDLRAGYAAIGIALHLGILLAFNVGPFSWISLAYYLCLWHPDEAPWRRPARPRN